MPSFRPRNKSESTDGPRMKRLILMRHGKSSWSSDAENDHARPLAPRGEEDVPRMADWLAQEGWQPDLIITSTAVRTMRTAEYCAAAFGLPATALRPEARLYEAAADEVLGVVQDAPARVDTLLVIGHNPGLEMLVEGLAGHPIPVARKQKPFPTAAVARFLIRKGNWHFQLPACELLDITRPKSLHKN